MDRIRIENAVPHQASTIASLVMLAMNHDCCQYFAGPHHTLDDFHRMLTRLVKRRDSQYSYQNTLVALVGEDVIGCCVSYDGSRLRDLRRAFLEETRDSFGLDHSHMADETQAGELYIDTLAVSVGYRGQGIATSLLQATCEKAAALHLPVGLLVDKGNPEAERLYKSFGFRYVNDAVWGTHPMRHLQRCDDGLPVNYKHNHENNLTNELG